MPRPRVLSGQEPRHGYCRDCAAPLQETAGGPRCPWRRLLSAGSCGWEKGLGRNRYDTVLTVDQRGPTANWR